LQNTPTQTQNQNTEKIENPNPDLNLCVYWVHMSDFFQNKIIDDKSKDGAL